MLLRHFYAATPCIRLCPTHLNTKVGCADVFVVEQLCTCPLKGYLSIFQNIGPVGNGERLFYVLFYDQYRRSFFFYSLYDVEYILHKDGRKAEGRFIEHLQFRFCHEAPSDSKHLLLTSA
jgi:hypothetical protein